MRRKLVLFGAGERGAKFLCMNFPHEVEAIFDNYKCGKFYGIEIEKPVNAGSYEIKRTIDCRGDDR